LLLAAALAFAKVRYDQRQSGSLARSDLNQAVSVSGEVESHSSRQAIAEHRVTTLPAASWVPIHERSQTQTSVAPQQDTKTPAPNQVGLVDSEVVSREVSAKPAVEVTQTKVLYYDFELLEDLQKHSTETEFIASAEDLAAIITDAKNLHSNDRVDARSDTSAADNRRFRQLLAARLEAADIRLLGEGNC
jgi:hypothetical protein